MIPRQQPLPGYYELVLDTLRQAGVTAPRLQQTRLLQTAVFLVSGKLGIALVPESFRQHLRVRGCVYRELAGPPANADLIGLWRRNNVPPALRRFIQQLSNYSTAHKGARRGGN